MLSALGRGCVLRPQCLIRRQANDVSAAVTGHTPFNILPDFWSVQAGPIAVTPVIPSIV